MRKVTRENMNYRSIVAKLAGALSLGVVSILMVSGLNMESASGASARDAAPIALNIAAVGVSYTSSTMTVATAGTWVVTAGTLPGGLGLTSNASSTTDTISGTPTSDGNYTFTVTVTDSVTPATYTRTTRSWLPESPPIL